MLWAGVLSIGGLWIAVGGCGRLWQAAAKLMADVECMLWTACGMLCESVGGRVENM